MTILIRSDQKLVYSITESRKISNFFWAFIILLGSLGFLLIGISSYLGMDFLLFFEEILDFPFIPQGDTMFFYGIVGLFISSYLWWTILWDVGSGYDIFDKKEKKVCFFRWGFPGKNRRIILEVPMEEVQSIRIIPTVKKGGIFTGTLTYDIVYMETIEQGLIPLTRSEDNLIPPQIADKAWGIARFLDVPVLY
nr:photosystem I assembly protein Ycf4 [Haymondia wallichii]WOV67747.1 photosystem I assembly protein Ycf4 [Haymondia wallichii]WOV67830.1 photosystem I assembly protein Ycf4 [Haymondia wallichii]